MAPKENSLPPHMITAVFSLSNHTGLCYLDQDVINIRRPRAAQRDREQNYPLQVSSFQMPF